MIDRTVNNLTHLGSATVRHEMAKIGWSVEDLAARCDYQPSGLSIMLGLGVPRITLRWKLEAALGFLPIWSSAEDVAARRRCVNAFQVDPRLLTGPELKAFCIKIGVEMKGVFGQTNCYQTLLAWLAAHPRIGALPEQKETS